MADPWVSPEHDGALPETRMVEVARLDVWSVARILGGVYGAFGVLAAVFLMMVGAQNSASLGFAALAPFLYAALGAVGGVVSAAVYNLVASAVGGVRFELR